MAYILCTPRLTLVAVACVHRGFSRTIFSRLTVQQPTCIRGKALILHKSSSCGALGCSSTTQANWATCTKLLAVVCMWTMRAARACWRVTATLMASWAARAAAAGTSHNVHTVRCFATIYTWATWTARRRWWRGQVGARASRNVRTVRCLHAICTWATWAAW